MILNEEKESRCYRAVKKTALLKGIILTKMVILLFELLSIFQSRKVCKYDFFCGIVMPSEKDNILRDMVKHELRIASYQLRVESLKAPVEVQKCKCKCSSYEFKSTSYDLNFTSYEFRSTSCQFKTKSSRIIQSMKTELNSLIFSLLPKIVSLKSFGNS